MKHLIMTSKRPFNTRAYVILVALLVPTELAILPYSVSLAGAERPGFWALMLGAAIDLLLVAVLAAAGLFIAGRIGLGMPFIEGWAKREPPWQRLPGVVGISILAGILLPFVLVLDSILAPFIKEASAMNAEGYAANAIDPPAWQGILAAFSAGVLEETMFRLFGLTLLAWLGARLFRSRNSRPTLRVLWTANILFALLFALAHLPTAGQMGIPLNAIAVIRILIVNGVGGVLFGWLYWSFGLESAMLAHISADVVVHGFVPLITQQADMTYRIITGAPVVLVTVSTVLWSVAAIRRDRALFSPSLQPGEPQVEADLSLPIMESRR